MNLSVTEADSRYFVNLLGYSNFPDFSKGYVNRTIWRRILVEIFQIGLFLGRSTQGVLTASKSAAELSDLHHVRLGEAPLY